MWIMLYVLPFVLPWMIYFYALLAKKESISLVVQALWQCGHRQMLWPAKDLILHAIFYSSYIEAATLRYWSHVLVGRYVRRHEIRRLSSFSSSCTHMGTQYLPLSENSSRPKRAVSGSTETHRQHLQNSCNRSSIAFIRPLHIHLSTTLYYQYNHEVLPSSYSCRHRCIVRRHQWAGCLAYRRHWAWTCWVWTSARNWC